MYPLQQKDGGGTIIVKMHASLYYANKDFFKKKLLEAIGFDPSKTLRFKKESNQGMHACYACALEVCTQCVGLSSCEFVHR